MTAAASAENEMLITREQGRNALNRALRLLVGRGRRYSVEQFCKGTGIPEWMLRTAMVEGSSTESRPFPPEAMLSAMLFLGEDFTNEFAPITNQYAVEAVDCDHDEVEASCLAYIARKAAAHHPDSPAGRDLSDCEQADLVRLQPRFRKVAA